MGVRTFCKQIFVRHLFIVTLLGLSACAVLQAAAINAPTWPLEIMGAQDAHITIYQPQIESFEDNKLTGRAAVSVKIKSTSSPVFGAVWFECKVMTDRDERTVTFESVDVTDAKFPEADPKKIDTLKDLLKQELTKKKYVISLDQLLASLEVMDKHGASVSDLKNDPPVIIFKNTPTALVPIDGTLRMKETSSGLQQIINTPMLLLYDPEKKKYYLQILDKWRSSFSFEGPWDIVSTLPKKLNNYIQSSPKRPVGASPSPENSVQPLIVVSTVPTELIVTKGEPTYQPIEGTDLLFISNTDHDVFRLISTQELFILVSGRWYKSSGPQGPWTNVAADQLPADFGKIPTNSPKADVRANVAGTPEAMDAVLDATIPQTSSVNRNEAKLDVTYDGEPKFKKVEGALPVEYAENTPNAVFKLNGHYFCCDKGIWYESNNAKGPWTVCSSVPHEIYEIPPSCPHYYCIYVKVYDQTPEVVVVGYTPGYMGCYVYGPTVVYGTGYYYYPWVSPYYYYPYPYSYGMGFRYYPYRGWGVSIGVGVTPYFGVSIGIGGGGYYGGGNMYVRNNNIIVNNGNRDRINHNNRNNIYNNRQNGAGASTMDRPGNSSRPTTGQGSRGGSANNLMADKDGNVYRNSDKGWEQRGKDGWSKPSGDSGSSYERNKSDLNSQQQIRDRSSGSSYNRGGSGSYGGGGSSYRGGGGGGGRGGGGRR